MQKIGAKRLVIDSLRAGSGPGNYLGTIGINNGLIVFVTSDPVGPAKASVTVELIS